MPQPKLPFWLRPFLVFLSVLPGIVLLILSSLYLIAYVYSLIVHPQLQFRFMLAALGLAGLWLLYVELPLFVRHKVRNAFRRSKQ